MPLVEQPVSAHTDQHARPIAAAACASRSPWNAASSLLTEVTSMGSRVCVRRSGPRSAPRTTEPLVQAVEAPDAISSAPPG